LKNISQKVEELEGVSIKKDNIKKVVDTPIETINKNTINMK
jgi:hypothetical protein